MPTKRTQPFEPLIDIEEVARLLHVDVRQVRRLVHERRILTIKWGHLLRFDPTEIKIWVEGHRIQPAAA